MTEYNYMQGLSDAGPLKAGSSTWKQPSAKGRRVASPKGQNTILQGGALVSKNGHTTPKPTEIERYKI